MLLVALTALLAIPHPLNGSHSVIQCSEGTLSGTTPQHTGQYSVLSEKNALQNRRERLDSISTG